MQAIRLFIPLLVFIPLLLTACEESVDPILESDRNFTLFGTLDLARDTQYVRVIPIRESLGRDSTGSLNITFEMFDLQSGERVSWRDSLVRFADGTFGHIFFAPMRMRSGHTYRVEIRSPEYEVITSAETTVPTIPRVTIVQEDVRGGAFGVVSAHQAVIWSGIEWAPYRVDQYYRFMLSTQGQFRDIILPYEPEYEALPPSVLQMDLNLGLDKRTLDTLFSTSSAPLAGLGMQVTMLDVEFSPPDGRFDPEVLVQPGTMSNVENGFGFVGSVGRFSVEWLLDRESVERLGYMTLDELYDVQARQPVVQVLPFQWSAMPE